MNVKKTKSEESKQRTKPTLKAKRIGTLVDVISQKVGLWSESKNNPQDKRRHGLDLINMSMQLLLLEGSVKQRWLELKQEIEFKTSLMESYPTVLEEVLNLQSDLISQLQMELYRCGYWSKETALERGMIGFSKKGETVHQVIKGSVEDDNY